MQSLAMRRSPKQRRLTKYTCVTRRIGFFRGMLQARCRRSSWLATASWCTRASSRPGYDKPPLHTRYVDKRRSGIKAVQTLLAVMHDDTDASAVARACARPTLVSGESRLPW
jgi:hypothetical protein